MMQWLAASSQVCSSWLVFLYTFERFISVRFPLKRAVICSGRRIRTAVLCILVFGPISQMHNLVLYEHRGTSCFVDYRSAKKIIYGYMKVFNWFLIGMFLPYCCIALLNAMIVYHMARYRRKRAALKASTTTSEERTQRSITVMLFTASTYSLLMVMPQIIANWLDPFNRLNNTALARFRYVAIHMIRPWNYCGNFFFYVIGGRQFRNELFEMIRCRKPRGKYKATDTVHYNAV